MDFWSRSVRKSGEEKARNDTICGPMDVGKDIWEITEERRLKLLAHVSRMPKNRLRRRILEWEPDGTRRKDPNKPECWVQQVLLTNLGLTEEILEAGTRGEINFGRRRTTAQRTNPWINEWKKIHDIRMWIRFNWLSSVADTFKVPQMQWIYRSTERL